MNPLFVLFELLKYCCDCCCGVEDGVGGGGMWMCVGEWKVAMVFGFYRVFFFEGQGRSGVLVREFLVALARLRCWLLACEYPVIR